MVVKLNEVYSGRTQGSNSKSPKGEAVTFFSRVTDSTAITVGILLSRVMPAHSGFDEVLSALFLLTNFHKCNSVILHLLSVQWRFARCRCIRFGHAQHGISFSSDDVDVSTNCGFSNCYFQWRCYHVGTLFFEDKVGYCFKHNTTKIHLQTCPFTGICQSSFEITSDCCNLIWSQSSK